MNFIRSIIATVLFVISAYLIFDLCINGFDALVLIACISSYLGAHFILPKHSDASSAWYDWLELIIELPFRIFTTSLKWLARIIRGSDNISDFDL